MEQVRPGDTLLLKTLRDAAAAKDLGFDLIQEICQVETRWLSKEYRTYEFSKILATETGPNAAERFLPQPWDWCKFKDHAFIMQVDPSWIWAQRSNNRWGFYINDGACFGAKPSFLIPERIVERPHNGEIISFPKYEVMK